MQWGVWHIEPREALHFAGGTARSVLPGADALMLDKGVDFPFHKTPVAGELEFQQRGIGQHAGEAHAIGCAEVPQTVSDEMLLVKFHRPHHVGAVAENDIRPRIDAEMRKLAQRATVFFAEHFRAIRQAVLAASFRASMERYYHDVAAVDQFGDDFTRSPQVLMAHGISVVAKGAQPKAHAVTLHHHTVGKALYACVSDTLAVQTIHGALHPRFTKVESVIVGQTEKIVAGLVQQGCIASGRSESITDVGKFLACLTAVAERAFQVACCQIGPLQHRQRINEQLPSLMGRQLHFWVGSTHHNISCKGHCHHGVVLLGKTAPRTNQCQDPYEPSLHKLNSLRFYVLRYTGDCSKPRWSPKFSRPNCWRGQRKNSGRRGQPP